MTERLSLEDYRRMVGLPEAVAPARRKARRYNNVPVVLPDGERCASGKEAAGLMAARVKAASGLLKGVVAQVRIPYGRTGRRRRYAVVDRLEIIEHHADGSMRVRLVDPKGHDTRHARTGRAALEEQGVLICLE